ncbi:MAG: Stp1/IreP family PP2C-type Ser/Thr phosphatase [Chloroflexota bacterium]
MADPTPSRRESRDGPGYAARSDVGVARSENEDRFLVAPPVFAVADGMGGHQAGEVAARLAIDLLEEAVASTPAPSPDDIVDAIERSNAAIRREARLRADLAGMGTTCTVVVVDAEIHVAHVGDSRAYRYRDGGLVQLTDDHSLVASMVRDGMIAPADALTDGRRNIITRALGAEDEIRVDVTTADRARGDRLLVCSDGLHGQVDDAAIAAVLGEEREPPAAADRLVALANAAGGDDNVTVIVIDADALVGAATEGQPTSPATADPPPADAATRAPRRGRGKRVAGLVLLVLVLIAVAIAIWLSAASTPVA